MNLAHASDKWLSMSGTGSQCCRQDSGARSPNTQMSLLSSLLPVLALLLVGFVHSAHGQECALPSLSRQGRKEGLTTSRGAWETAPPQITRHGSAFGLILALSPTSSKLNSFSFSRHAMMSSQESRYVQHHWSLAWLPLPLPPCVARSKAL